MDGYVRAVAGLCRACGIVAVVLIVASVLIVCQMVLWRYGLGLPTVWQTEVVIYALVATTLIGSPYVLWRRGHVNMDIVVLYASPRTRRRMAIAATLISLAFCALLAVYGAGFWYEAWSKGWRSDTLTRIPLWIPYLALPLGMAIMSLQLVAELLGLLSGRTPPFGLPEEVGPAAVLGHDGEQNR